MSQDLRSQVIKLAHANPELRPHLLPLLEQTEKVASSWEPVVGAGLEKFRRVFGQPERDQVTAKKFGRKTVFCVNSGVLRLYCAGDDRNIYSMKLHTGFPPADRACLLLVDRASGLLDPLEAQKEGIYFNGRLGV